MINISTIIAVCVTLFITLILPILVMVAYGIKYKGKGLWSAWFIGAICFVIVQMVVRIPLLNTISAVPGFTAFATNHFILYSFLLASTAALFEVVGRYIAARIMKDNIRLTLHKGIAAGLGHGGIEAMLLIGMTYISNLVYIFMINSGSFDTLIEQRSSIGADVTTLTAVKESLISGSAVLYYLAGYERILTMIMHLAMSFLVCYCVWKGCARKGILISFGFHWLLDFAGPFLAALATPYLGNLAPQWLAYLLSYLFMTAMAAASVYAIIRIYRMWNADIVARME